MLVDKEQEDVLIQILIIVVHLLIQEKELEGDVMWNNGLNHQNILIDMIRYLKINVNKHIVGNLMIFLVHINV